MKGLMIKDLYCLRRKMTIWGITVLMTSIVCVMFIFSAKYGNLAKAFDGMRRTEEEATVSFLVPFLIKEMLIIFLLLPLGASFDLIQSVFIDDKNASFYKVASTLPVTRYERVGARALLILSSLGIGMVIDLVLLSVCRAASDLLSFRGSIEIILTFAGAFLMCQAVALFFGYLDGTAAMYGNLATGIALLLIAVIANRKMLQRVFSAPEELKDAYLFELFNSMIRFIENKGHWVFLCALPVFAVCYFLACCAAGRKRGVA
ncbi:MAG: ABC-2 transporter permease [Lachnospiraceae bacterium]|nr:ABC-2 transporter permease [Lachnospiraceae bacterium]